MEPYRAGRSVETRRRRGRRGTARTVEDEDCKEEGGETGGNGS